MKSTPSADELVDSWLTLPDIAERLGIDVGKVRRLIQEGRLVGVRRGTPPVLSVPEAFLVPADDRNPRTTPGADADEDVEVGDGPAWAVLAWLQGTLTVLSDAAFSDDEAIAWLFTPEESLGARPIDALRSGQKTQVRRSAQAML